MKDYLFLFRGNDALTAKLSPEQMQQHIQKAIAWIEFAPRLDARRRLAWALRSRGRVHGHLLLRQPAEDELAAASVCHPDASLVIPPRAAKQTFPGAIRLDQHHAG